MDTLPCLKYRLSCDCTPMPNSMLGKFNIVKHPTEEVAIGTIKNRDIKPESYSMNEVLQYPKKHG